MSCRPIECDSRVILIFFALVGFSAVAIAGVGQWTAAGPEGGALWSVKIDPQEPANMYVAAQGVWKSTDGGSSWISASQGMPSERTRALVIDPVHPETVYAGTYGYGVFKTIDGGGTWSEANTGLPEDRVWCMAIDPVTPSTVYVGLRSGGLHRSLDSGATWQSLNNGISADYTVVELAIDATAPQTIYAGSWDGFFKTTDGGATWEDLGDLLPNHAAQAVAIDPTNSATVYVGLGGGGIYKSTDSGASWQDMSSGLTTPYIEAIVVDPLTPETLYAGTGGDGVFKSVDGGVTWLAVNDGMPFPSVYDLCLSPTDPTTVFAASHGAGVFKSTNGAVSWAPTNTGLHAAWVDSLVADPGVPGSVRAGSLNGVWTSTDGAASWQSANGDLEFLGVGSLASDPSDSDILFAGTWEGLYKTTDGGATWVRRDEGLTRISFEMVATDPAIADRMYVGVADGLHISSDGGESWTQPETGPQGKRVMSMAFDPVLPSTMYVGAWGGLYRSDDGGATWTSSLDEERIWDVAVDPVDTNTLYACSYNLVSKSTDGGGSWTAASDGLTEQYCWALAIDPVLHETIYMGSGAGVFVSHDGAGSWERLHGVDDVNVKDLVFDASGSTLYAGLRGGGVAAYTFAAGGTCTLECSTVVPDVTRVGVTVQVQGEATATGCDRQPSYLWDFGDGSGGASGQSSSHHYGAAGDYTWTMTATIGEVTCSESGEISVAPFQPTWFVPAVAHSPGAAGTAWRTDVTVVGGEFGSADLQIDFVPYGGGAERHRQHQLASEQTMEWQDILVTLFGFPDGTNVKGTLKVGTDAPVFITARTYNQTASGTYGQYIPALPAAPFTVKQLSPGSKVVATGEVGVIPHIKSNAGFRTNIGVQNLGAADTEVAITLFGADGSQIGSSLTQTVGVGRYWQQDDVFAAVGAGDSDLAYALVEVVSPDGAAWFYGSVVDNATGDPTTVPARRPSGGDALVAGVAHSPGAADTTWRTDLAVVNLGTAESIQQLEFAAYEGGAVTAAEVKLDSMATGEWRDALVSLFKADPEDSNKGTLRVPDASELCINSRTYNQTAVGTFGQLMPAVRLSEGFESGDLIVIPGLKKNAAFRSNVGALNLSSFPVTVAVTLFNAAGDQAGDMVFITIGASEYGQIDNVFGVAHAGNCNLGYALLDVQTPAGRVWAYGSVIDNATGDPTTVPALGY